MTSGTTKAPSEHQKPTSTEDGLVGLRCFHCGKLLAKHNLTKRQLELKCLRCGELNPVLNQSHEQVIITDVDGVVIYTNALVESVTGYTNAEIIGKTPALWGKQMSPAFYKVLWHTIKTEKKPIEVQVTNRRKDGTLYKALLKISPVFNADRTIALFVATEVALLD